MKLYILRHGETDLNVKGVLQGRLDEPLNENGRALAALAGQGMRGIRFDRCVSSPLVRARTTAELVLRESGNEIPITLDERLLEIDFGDMEGRMIAEMGEEGFLFYTDPFRFPGFPHGETIRGLCERTQSFLKELLARDDGQTWLISTHGCALRAMINCLFDDPENFWRGRAPYNCSVCVVETEGGAARITALDRVYYDPALIVDRFNAEKLIGKG